MFFLGQQEENLVKTNSYSNIINSKSDYFKAGNLYSFKFSFFVSVVWLSLVLIMVNIVFYMYV